MKKLSFHPFADLLPMMSAEELDALKADIAANGQRDPIILLDGQILDGRNRYTVCQALKVEPKCADFAKSWGDPLSYVISKATHRNMSDSQKGAAGILVKREIAKARKASFPKTIADLKIGDKFILKGESFERTLTAKVGDSVVLTRIGHKGDHISTSFKDLVERMEKFPSSQVKGASRDLAGNLFGVSGRYIDQAEQILEADPKLFREVFDGKQTIPAALSEVRRRAKSKQTRQQLAALPPIANEADAFTLICDDHLKALSAFPLRSFRLGFVDPPYNIGIPYEGDPHADKLPDDKYLSLCRTWMAEYHRVLTPDGTLWVMINEPWVCEFGMMLKREGFTVRRLITWYETFGNNCRDNFNSCSRYLFYCVKKADNFVFHHDAFNRPSDRQAKYGDARANPAGKTLDSVWTDIPRLVDNAKERLPDFPTQLPLALLSRIILGCSDPGDHVLDICNGSGTTGHAAILAGRKYTGIDRCGKYIEASRQRLRLALAQAQSK